MRKSPINSVSLKWSCGLHGLLLFSVAVVQFMPQFRPRAPIVVTEFTVVVDENLIAPDSADQPVAPTPDPTPPPEPEPPREPDKPAPLPEPKDVIPIEPVKKKEPPKKVEPQKTEPKKTDFVKGKRVERPPDKKQPDFTTLKPVTDKALSQKEIRDLLKAGATIGSRNQVPPNEESRCLSLITRALYDAWEQPGSADAGGRPAVLTITLDANGGIASYRIRQSSGSDFFDKTVLKAAANCKPIRGLTQAFLKQYGALPVEFRLQ